MKKKSLEARGQKKAKPAQVDERHWEFEEAYEAQDHVAEERAIAFEQQSGMEAKVPIAVARRRAVAEKLIQRFC